MAEQPGMKLVIPFTDPLQHMYDPTRMKVADNLGSLNELYPSSEILYANFSVDAGTISKRGGREIVLYGSDNTGVIEDGILQIAKNLDRSAAKYESISLPTPNEVSGKVRSIINAAGYGGNKYIKVIQNLHDDSRIAFYTQHIGANLHRINVEVLDADGTVMTRSILDTKDYDMGTVVHITYSFKRGENLYCYVDGEHKLTMDVSAWNVNFSQVDLTFGQYDGTSNTFYNIDFVQFINADYYYSEGDVDTDQPYSYDQTYQEMITVAPTLMDKFLKFYPTYNFIDTGDIRHRIMIGAAYYFYNTVDAQWQPVANPATDFNTIDEINDHCQELELNEGVGSVIQYTTLIKSTDGFEAPSIVTIGLEYRMFFTFGQATPTCLIYGKVEDAFAEAVEGASVRFIPDEGQFADKTQVGGGREIFTESNGKWSQGYTQGMTGTFCITYKTIDCDGDDDEVQLKYTDITIPAQDSIDFEELING